MNTEQLLKKHFNSLINKHNPGIAKRIVLIEKQVDNDRQKMVEGKSATKKYKALAYSRITLCAVLTKQIEVDTNKLETFILKNEYTPIKFNTEFTMQVKQKLIKVREINSDNDKKWDRFIYVEFEAPYIEEIAR